MSVVVLELNEVPWKVLDWWTARRPSGAIAGLVRDAAAFTSVAPDEGHLSPWITWPTVHRGVPNTVHGIGHFGQDTGAADVLAPPWWRTVHDAGRRVGVFGLLHTSVLPDDVADFAFFVPDTFAPTDRTHPASLEPFQAFNLRMARASARNVDTGIDRDAALRFLSAAPRLGLRPRTVAALAGQLLDERVHPLHRVRRRSFQSVIGFDLFVGQLRATGPDVAAFFTNHVASAMHRYWAATFPEDYPPGEFGFDVDWVRTWRSEIDAAMVHAESMVGRLRRHCERTGSTLLVVTSMGQQAAQGTPIATQLTMVDVSRLLADAGLDAAEADVRPAMVPHANVMVTGGAADRLRRYLGELRIGGLPLVWTEADGLFSLEFGQADDAIGAITTADRVRQPAELGLEITEIEDEAASTGYHIPEGVLLVFDPVTAVMRRDRPEVPTTAIAPTIHSLVGLAPAAHHVAAPLHR